MKVLRKKQEVRYGGNWDGRIVPNSDEAASRQLLATPRCTVELVQYKNKIYYKIMTGYESAVIALPIGLEALTGAKEYEVVK